MSDVTVHDLLRQLPALAEQHEVPGAAVAVLRGPDTATASVGVTSTTDPLPVDEDTLFFWGSTTKTLTATAVMSQVESGAVRLDDLVGEVLPELRLHDPAVLEVLTVGMLLDHTGGWRGDSVVDTGWGEDALARAVAEAVPLEPQVTAPGTVASYNNSAVLVAGRLLEVLTDRPYHRAVTDLVLAPLGMTSTSFLPWEVTGRRLAQGHLPGGVPLPGWPLTRASGPGGGAAGSLSDHVRWARWCLRGETDGSRPLSDAARLAMMEPRVAARSGITGVGTGWLLQQRGRTRLVTHGGNVSNLHLSTFVMAPDADVAVVALTNARGGHALGQALVDLALSELAAEPLPAAMPAVEADLEELVGDYDAGAWRQRLSLVDGRLHVQMVLSDEVAPEVRANFAAPPAEVLIVGEDQLALASRPWEPAGDVGRGADGRVAWLRWGFRVLPRVPA